MSLNVKKKGAISRTTFAAAALMGFQNKLIHLSDRETYLIIIGRGVINIYDLKDLFHEIDLLAASMPGRKVLIDLGEATCSLNSHDIDAFLAGLNRNPWSDDTIVALVVRENLGTYPWLPKMRSWLLERGLRFAVFADSNVAAHWLSLEA